MLRVSLEFDPTPEDLAAAGLVLNALREAPARQDISRDDSRPKNSNHPADSGPKPTCNDLPAAWKVHVWFPKLGENARSFWLLAARHAQENPTWTLKEIEAVSGIEPRALKSYLRNSYRAIHASKAADPLLSDWDSVRRCNVYRFRDDIVRDEVLRYA
jgi:hypothetical protein